MIKPIHNEQGNKEHQDGVYWVPKEAASQCEASWGIIGHLHLPQVILLLLSKRSHITATIRRTEIPSGPPCWVTFHQRTLLAASAWNENPWHDAPNLPLQSLEVGWCKRLVTVWVMHSSHFPYLVFVIKTCLLKHRFPLPRAWKIYGYCIVFHISALNSRNTQAIFLVITDDFSSNLKLSSLTLTLTVSILSFNAS